MKTFRLSTGLVLWVSFFAMSLGYEAEGKVSARSVYLEGPDKVARFGELPRCSFDGNLDLVEEFGEKAFYPMMEKGFNGAFIAEGTDCNSKIQFYFEPYNKRDVPQFESALDRIRGIQIVDRTLRLKRVVRVVFGARFLLVDNKTQKELFNYFEPRLFEGMSLNRVDQQFEAYINPIESAQYGYFGTLINELLPIDQAGKVLSLTRENPNTTFRIMGKSGGILDPATLTFSDMTRAEYWIPHEPLFVSKDCADQNCF
jgi:hypothetical protein